MTRVQGVVLAVLLAAVGCKKDPNNGQEPSGGSPSVAKADPTPKAPTEASAAAAPKAKVEGCNSDFEQALEANFTLTEKCSPFTLKRDLTIDGFDLTVEPGVELRLGEGVSITVGYARSGRLVARGTAEKPVRLVAADRKEPGSWAGVDLDANAGGSALVNVVLEHAGRGGVPALGVKAGGVTLSNLKVLAVKAASLDIDAKEPLAALSGLELSGAGPAEVAMTATFDSLGTLAVSGTFAPAQVIALRGNVNRDVTLLPLAPYRLLSSVSVDGEAGKTATLRAGPGVALQLAESTSIDVGYNVERPGSLQLVGAADKPVTVQRFGDDAKDSPAPGVHLYGGARSTRLEDVVFQNVGQKGGAAVIWDGAKQLGTVKRVLVRDTPGSGLLVREAQGARFTALEDTKISGVGESAISAPASALHQLAPSNSFSARVELNEGTVSEDLTLSALSVSYRSTVELRVEGAEEGKSATLTLAPGATLELGSGAAISVGYNRTGALVAKGTAAKAITFKPLEAAFPGVHAYSKGTLTLENVTVRGGPADGPAVVLDPGAQGALKELTFDTPVGLRNCSKATASGLKAGKGQKAETKEGC